MMAQHLMEDAYRAINRRAEDIVGWRSWTPVTCLTALMIIFKKNIKYLS